jgi:hypothetical protein
VHTRPTNRAEHETNWAELFSDLTYVGVAFQEGALLADSLSRHDFARGFAIFLVTFVLFYDVWRTRLQLSARFHARDIMHKLLDIIQMLFVAAAALHVGTLDKFRDLTTYYSLGFSIAMTGLTILSIIRGLELLVASPLLVSRGMGEQMVRREVLPLVFNLAGVYCSIPSSGYEWYVPVAAWGLVLVVVRFDLFLRIYFGKHLPKVYAGRIGQQYSVPSKHLSVWLCLVFVCLLLLLLWLLWLWLWLLLLFLLLLYVIKSKRFERVLKRANMLILYHCNHLMFRQ